MLSPTILKIGIIWLFIQIISNRIQYKQVLIQRKQYYPIFWFIGLALESFILGVLFIQQFK